MIKTFYLVLFCLTVRWATLWWVFMLGVEKMYSHFSIFHFVFVVICVNLNHVVIVSVFFCATKSHHTHGYSMFRHKIRPSSPGIDLHATEALNNDHLACVPRSLHGTSTVSTWFVQLLWAADVGTKVCICAAYARTGLLKQGYIPFYTHLHRESSARNHASKITRRKYNENQLTQVYHIISRSWWQKRANHNDNKARCRTRVRHQHFKTRSINL